MPAPSMHTRPVVITLPGALADRLDAEVERLRQEHPDQIINRSQVVRHLLASGLGLNEKEN